MPILKVINYSYSSPYGFRQGHSTEFAALELLDKIEFLMQEGKVPVGVFLDMSKAFDTLNHDILLDKLSYLGISGISKYLLASYLSNRQQYVSFDNHNYDRGSPGINSRSPIFSNIH